MDGPFSVRCTTRLLRLMEPRSSSSNGFAWSTRCTSAPTRLQRHVRRPCLSNIWRAYNTYLLDWICGSTGTTVSPCDFSTIGSSARTRFCPNLGPGCLHSCYEQLHAQYPRYGLDFRFWCFLTHVLKYEYVVNLLSFSIFLHRCWQW